MEAFQHNFEDAKDLHADGFSDAILRHLIYSVGKDISHAVERDWCCALALAVRDRIVEGWIDTTRQIYKNKQKRVYYLSMEFMIGRMLEDSLTNLGLMEDAKNFLKKNPKDEASAKFAFQRASQETSYANPEIVESIKKMVQS